MRGLAVMADSKGQILEMLRRKMWQDVWDEEREESQMVLRLWGVEG